MGSFFRNQTFPQNWHRRGTQDESALNITSSILLVHPEVVPGANDPSTGVYKPDTVSDPNCAVYQNLAVENLPAVLYNTTGILKKNVDTLLMKIFETVGVGCEFQAPTGAAGV